MMNLSLLTDLYELTMLEGYYQSGKIGKRARDPLPGSRPSRRIPSRIR